MSPVSRQRRDLPPLRRASMREVAELAGVAVSSVSRVLSEHPDVSPVMRERVLAAVDRLGYEPDLLAQSMRRQATLTVGFIVRDISNPLFAEIAMGAEAELSRAGYSMLLANSEGDPEADARHLRLFAQRRVDALLLSLSSEDHAPSLALLANSGIPAVVLDRTLPPEIGVGRVLSDHRSGMKAAVSELLDLGHRRIALISGSPLRPTEERRHGLVEAFEERSLEPTYSVVGSGWSPESGASAMRELLAQPERASAVIVGGNELLTGVLEEIEKAGLTIGDELSLVSCDEVVLTRFYRPPIAVIERDSREIGRAAAELALQSLREEGEYRDLRLPTRFVLRGSCAPAPQA